MYTSSSAAFSSLDHLSPPPPPPPPLSSEQLCYVHCNFCDTVLAVSVPYSSLFKTVTVRCGHCTNLLFVNMRNLLLLSPNQLQCFLAPPHHNTMLDEIACPLPSLLMDPPNLNTNFMPPAKGVEQERIQAPIVNRPPEKRQRVLSAYNRFIKDEIQRIKAGNPDITHREAFSAAAKNWAHFPHMHFGLMPDQGLKKNSICVSRQEGEVILLKDGFYNAPAAANMSVAPF